jgi:peptidyl-prolyl cis-trans isomerase A (cyclophilin A)
MTTMTKTTGRCSVLLLTLLGFGCNSGSGADGGVDRTIAADTRAEAARPEAGLADRTGGEQARPDGAAHGPRVLVHTSMGDLTLELDDQKAPISTKNFLDYVDAKFYDGTIFHRVIADFMIQGGGYDTSLNQKQTRAAIKNEAGNGLSNLRGTVAMARTSVVDSATSQFFINVVDNLFLNHKDETAANFGYAVFGKVVQGMDVVDAIKAVPTGAKGIFTSDCPLTDVVIQSAARAN